MLAWSYRKLADTRKLSQDPIGARGDYNEAIKIARELVESHPGHLSFINHLAVTLNDLAGVLQGLHQYAEARALHREAVDRFSELAALDPDNLLIQSRLVHAEVDRARLEQEVRKFANAAKLYRRPIERLSRLKRAGRALGRADLLWNRIDRLEATVTYCEAAPAALADFEFARSRPPAIAAPLILLRLKTSTERGASSEADAMFEALCALTAQSAEDHFEKARCLALSLAELQNFAPAAAKETMEKRGSGLAVDSLCRAAELGYANPDPIELERAFAPLRHHPRYSQAIDRVKANSTLLERRGPAR
jgi:tetratricopeptide (TPR) repeat protein